MNNKNAFDIPIDQTNIDFGNFGFVVEKLTNLDPKSFHQRLLKNMEELGELSQAFLALEKASGCAYKSNGTDMRKKVLEESVDNLLCAMSLVFDAMNRFDLMDDDLKKEVYEKLTKWLQVV